MFSEELYELDRNTVQYMIDEMQDELDATQTELDAMNLELNITQAELDVAHTKLDAAHNELNEMTNKYKQAIQNTIKILNDIGLSEQEIVDKICDLYQFNEKQAREYL